MRNLFRLRRLASSCFAKPAWHALDGVDCRRNDTQAWSFRAQEASRVWGVEPGTRGRSRGRARGRTWHDAPEDGHGGGDGNGPGDARVSRYGGDARGDEFLSLNLSERRVVEGKICSAGQLCLIPFIYPNRVWSTDRRARRNHTDWGSHYRLDVYSGAGAGGNDRCAHGGDHGIIHGHASLSWYVLFRDVA